MERFGPSLVLLDKLAAGGMAEVYRAKQLGHGGFEKVVAVKRILPQYAESEDFKEMFLQEASLSAHLQHPNVVQTYSNGEVGGYLYLTMEFVDGKNLRQILAKIDRQKKRIPIEYALFLIGEAAKGLHYAHEYVDERSGQAMSIVHRDMSPQNIMLGYDGTVKIVDFGIAKMAAQAESTRAGVLKGKFGYMSPEQARGMQLDRRTDIFALGIILFEVLTQRRLFASDDDMRTLRLVKDCRIPRPSKYNPSIGPKLDQIVLKALAKEKSERFGSGLDLYEDLQRLLQELYPKFIPSDFSKFLKNTFLEEIREEKQKREKLHREAPALLDSARYDSRVDHEMGRKESKKEPGERGNVTMVEDDQATQVSNIMEPVDGLEVPELEGSRAPNRTAGDDASFQQDLNAAAEHSKISELQLDSPHVISADLPAPKSFDGPQKTFVGVAPDPILRDAHAPNQHHSRPHKVKRDSAKFRRMAYVALVLIGVVVFLADNEPKKEIAKVQQPGAATSEAVAEPATESHDSQAEPVVAAEPATPPDSTVAVVDAVTGESAAEIVAPVVPEVSTPEADSDNEQQSPESGLAGYLSIASYPDADSVVLNGQVMRNKSGEPLKSPISNLALTPGVYEVVLQNTTFKVSWRGQVQIRSQKISPLLDVVLK